MSDLFYTLIFKPTVIGLLSFTLIMSLSWFSHMGWPALKHKLRIRKAKAQGKIPQTRGERARLNLEFENLLKKLIKLSLVNPKYNEVATIFATDLKGNQVIWKIDLSYKFFKDSPFKQTKVLYCDFLDKHPLEAISLMDEYKSVLKSHFEFESVKEHEENFANEIQSAKGKQKVFAQFRQKEVSDGR